MKIQIDDHDSEENIKNMLIGEDQDKGKNNKAIEEEEDEEPYNKMGSFNSQTEGSPNRSKRQPR